MTISVQVRGRILTASLTPAVGHVVFQLNTPLLDPTGNTNIVPVPIKAVLDATGAFAVTLTATDDPSLQASLSPVRYQVTETFRSTAATIGVDNIATVESYAIVVPSSAAVSGLELSDIVRLPLFVPGPQLFVYALSTELAVETAARIAADATAVTALAGKQPFDSDLTAIAAVDSAVAGVLASEGAGWLRRTYGQVKTALGLVKADVGLGLVDNTADSGKPVSAAQQTALDAKLAITTANATYAALTTGLLAIDGTPVPDSAFPATLARDTEVAAAVAALVAAAPGTLDTLDELAAALGDDPSFAASMATALAGKQPLDPDLTAIAALATTAYGRAFLALVDAPAGRTALGLGTASTRSTGILDGEVPLLSTGGRLPIARVASGVPTGALFVRDDGTLAAPAVGSARQVVRKTADTSVVSSATFAADPHLRFPVAAGERWVGYMVVIYGAPNTNADILLSVDGTNVTGTYTLIGPSPATVNLAGATVSYGGAGPVRPLTSASGVVLGTGGASGGTDRPAVAQVWFDVLGGATAGEVFLTWAQGVSDTGATTVKTGSYLVAEKVS